MTRSDNPFADLPEWRERRRLEATHGQSQEGAGPAAYPDAYPQGYSPDAYESGHMSAGQTGYAAGQQPYGQDAQFYEVRHTAHSYTPYADGGQGPAPHSGETSTYAASRHGANGYETSGYEDTGSENPHGPHGQRPAPVPYYDPHSQITYPVAPNGGSPYSEHLQGQPTYTNGQREPLPSPGHDNFGFRPTQFEHPAAYQPEGSYPGSQQAATDYDPRPITPGQPVRGDAASGYYDPNMRPDEQWRDGQTGMAGGALAAEAGAADDDDYQDEDLEPSRYSWKLLAAVVVTGAVVTGGGVVLYDSFKSGGFGSRGAVPLIKAEQGPAKTTPDDAGGRQFAHRDSKLLGRLDGSRDTTSTGANAGETDANRVRSVPTVRIGKDGRLILPKAPEAVEAPKQVASATNVPGINVVDSLSNGSAGSGPGGLPPVVPKSAPPLASAPSAPSVPIPEARPPKRTAAIPRAPVIKNRAAATQPSPAKAAPTPATGASAVGSAWRMTSTRSSSGGQNTGGIQPTIAQPIVVPPTVETPKATASTLGAGAVAGGGQARGYVAVLATAKTSVAALQSFAELRQKHPTALASKVPGVQRADLKSRGLGVMYRLVVGPAGSRSNANALCNSLKAEGYKGCWVKSN